MIQKTRRAPLWVPFLLLSQCDLVAVLLVVGLSFDHPIPGLEGLLATRQVLLRDERSLVLGDFHQIRFTGLDRSGNCGEASANCELLAGRLSATLHFSTEVETVAVFRLGRCYAVGTGASFRRSVDRSCSVWPVLRIRSRYRHSNLLLPFRASYPRTCTKTPFW